MVYLHKNTSFTSDKYCIYGLQNPRWSEHTLESSVYYVDRHSPRVWHSFQSKMLSRRFNLGVCEIWSKQKVSRSLFLEEVTSLSQIMNKCSCDIAWKLALNNIDQHLSTYITESGQSWSVHNSVESLHLIQNMFG